MNTDATYAISMFSHYYAQIIPNVNAGFIRGYIRKDIWVSLQGAYIRGGLSSGFYVISRTIDRCHCCHNNGLTIVIFTAER